MVNVAAAQLALANLRSTSSGGFDFSILTGSSSSGTPFSAGGVKVALDNAEKNEAKQLAQAAKDPTVKRELARYNAVVKKAKTIDDVLNDPVARKVFMKANGLGQYVDQIALAKKAIGSDPSDSASLANRLSGTNRTWLDVATKYNFTVFGLTELKLDDSLKEVAENYVGEVRLDNLDAQMPGLGTALLFKEIAPSLDNPIKILGSALGREVITTALGLPKQIAVQSLDAQSKAITQRLNISKLKDPEFVDKLVQRYLIQLNGGTGGVTA